MPARHHPWSALLCAAVLGPPLCALSPRAAANAATANPATAIPVTSNPSAAHSATAHSATAPAKVERIDLKDVSLDKPLVLDEFADYRLRNVTVAGVHDAAALTLAGRIRSVLIEHSSFGRAYAGPNAKAAALACAGALIGQLTATDTSFFDAEHQLASLKEGAFGRVRFERCRFSTSEPFLKQLYAADPWRPTLPTTEFYNIERLELLDNEYANTTILIHPSVKQVILRGPLPGLKIQNTSATQVIHLSPGALAESVPTPPAATVANLPLDPTL